MEGVVAHDFHFRLKEATKRISTGNSCKKHCLWHKQKRNGPCIISLNNIIKGVKQSPFLCLCNNRNMAANLLMMMLLSLNSLLRKNLFVELQKLNFHL